MISAPAIPDVDEPTLGRASAVDRFLTEEIDTSRSELWHKVALTTPALAPHATITRQSFGTQIVYVVEDPAAGQFYRLTEPAYIFVGLLDGRRSVESAWEACGAILGDAAPTQRACVEVLSMLQGHGLLRGELPLEASLVAGRRRKARERHRSSRTGRGLAPVIPLVNPERFLEAISPLLRRVFSRTGLVFWSLLVLLGGTAVLSTRGKFWQSANQILDPGNLLLLSVLFIVIRAWHELGHACATKAMGGRCTQIGLMFFAYVLPFPYCDASSAWRFQEVWRRVVVSAGGILFELALAAVAAIVWSITEPGTINTLAFNAMVLSSVTTLVFNLNPLLRYDGYYILSDILGIANLSQRSTDMLKYVVERGIFSVRAARPPAVRSRGEAGVLLTYAVLSWPYRVLVTFTIVVVVASQYLALGVILAVILACVWLIWPVLKGVGYLIASPRLLGRRGRALGIVGGVLLAVFLIGGLVPMPAASYAPASIEPRLRSPVRNTQAGFVSQLHFNVGDRVRAGDVLVTLSNPEIESSVAAQRARLEQAVADFDAQRSAGDVTKIEVAELKVQSAQRDLASAQREQAELILTAPADGVITFSGGQVELNRHVGTFVVPGTLLGEVLAADQRIIASVSDREQAHIFGPDPTRWAQVPAEVRVRGQGGSSLTAKVERVYPAGLRQIENAALSSLAKGEVAMDPTDPRRERTLTPQFKVELIPDAPVPAGAGTVARVRFELPPEPLFSQYLRKVRQFLAARWA